MLEVSPPLGCPLEIRDLRRFAATMVGRLIGRLEKLKWKLEERPSREQVVAWQRTVFEPMFFWPSAHIDPIEVSAPNACQVCRYFGEFKTAWINYRERPTQTNKTHLRHISAQLNGELAEAYGLPAVALER
jgi:hypothetical protein